MNNASHHFTRQFPSALTVPLAPTSSDRITAKQNFAAAH